MTERQEEKEFFLNLEQEAFQGRLDFCLLEIDKKLNSSDDQFLLKLHLFQVFIYFLQGNIDLAYRRLNAQMKKPVMQKYKQLEFQAWIYFSFIAQSLSNDELIEQSAMKALDLAKSFEDEKKLSAAYTAVAWSLYARNFFDSSQEYIQFARPLSKDKITDFMLSECQSMCYFQTGKIKNSLELLIQVKKRIEEEEEPLILLPRVLTKLGMIYSTLGRYHESEERYFKSIALSKEMGAILLVAENHIYLGFLERKQGNFLKAIDLMVTGLDYCDKYTAVGSFKGWVHTSIAEVYLEIGDIPQVKKHLDKANEFLTPFKESREYGLLIIAFGKLAGLNGNFEKSKELLHEANELFRQREDKINLLHSYSALAYIYHLAGNFEESFEFFEKYRILSLENEIKSEFIATMSEFIFLLLDIGDFFHLSTILSLIHLELELSDSASDFDVGLVELITGACDLDLDNLGHSEKALINAENILLNFGTTSALIKAIVLLAELYFKKYLIHTNPLFITRCIKNLDQAIALAKQFHLNLILAEILIVRSEIYTLQNEYDKALELTNEAMELSQQFGLELLRTRVQMQLINITNRRQALEFIKELGLPGGKDLINDVSSINVLNTIHKVTGRFKKTDALQRNHLFISVFKLADQGTETVSSDVLPIHSENTNEMKHVLINMGVFYLTALGQGDKYNEGLFGPLPFYSNSDYAVLIYAKLVTDRLQSDHRLVDKTYALFCFTYPKHLNPDRELLTKTITNELKTTPDINDFTDTILKKIKKSLTEN